MRRVQSVLRTVQQAVDQLLGLGSSGFPPAAPSLQVISNLPAKCASTSVSMQQIVDSMSILWGVPKYRTSKPKKMTRKFSYTRLFAPKTNLVTCNKCGEQHEAETICGNCYQKVRELTNSIKEKMMQYNPYKGERQDKEVHVRFLDDIVEDGVVNGKRIVELEQPRPTWFKRVTSKE